MGLLRDIAYAFYTLPRGLWEVTKKVFLTPPTDLAEGIESLAFGTVTGIFIGGLLPWYWAAPLGMLGSRFLTPSAAVGVTLGIAVAWSPWFSLVHPVGAAAGFWQDWTIMTGP